MKQRGYFWHVHDKVLMEYCWSYDHCAKFIRQSKPKREIPLRLRLLKPVRGKLPAAIMETRVAYRKAEAAYRKAFRAWEKANAVVGKASLALDHAEAARDKALADNRAAIEELHARECPNCPWNGKTIFPKSQARTANSED